MPQNQPTTSNLNFPARDDRANAVSVALGSGGTVSITYAAPTTGPTAHVVFDVSGYFTADVSGGTFHGLAPTRLLDTRNGTGLTGGFQSHVARAFAVAGGTSPVPANATAVTGNVTVTEQSAAGYVYVGPDLINNPTSSTVNFPLNDNRANAVTVALGAGGKLAATLGAGTGATVQLIFDVTGYFTPDQSGDTYVPLVPARLLDTRSGVGLSGVFASHSARSFQVTGQLIPGSAAAVTGNLTVTQQSAGGYLLLGPTPVDFPTSSTLNFPAGDDRANAATVALGSGGTLSVVLVSGTVGTCQVVFDATGYFAP